MKRGRVESEPDVEFLLIDLLTNTVHDTKISVLSSGSHRFDENKDSIFYGIYFRPVIQNAKDYVMFAIHDGKVVFSSRLLPQPTPGAKTAILDRVYWTFETHSIMLDEKETSIYGMYIELENTGTKTVKIEPAIDMSVTWLTRTFTDKRFTSLPFFPPDIDPAEYNLKIDVRKIAQKTPLWFKLRGDVTGTKMYTLIGFWVPTKEKDPTWTFDGEKVFDAFSRENMRFGSQSEDYAIMMLLLFRPNISIELVGCCPAPPPYPSNWNASPDALIFDPNMSWAEIPETTSAQYTLEDGFDPRQGVMEIKSSKTKLNMAAYFYPQIYMEMITTKRIWTDLVRYRRTSVNNGDGTWSYKHVARIYRVYRHKKTEETIVRLGKMAYANRATLQTLVHTNPEYIAIRHYFEELAEQATYVEITLDDCRDCNGEQIFKDYYKRKRELAKPLIDTVPTNVTKRSKTDNGHVDWKIDIDNRNEVIVNGGKTGSVLRQLLAEQIVALTNVLKEC